VRHATGLPDRVDIALDDVDDGGAVLGLDRAGDVETVDVKRRLLQPIADLFALDQEELLVGAVQRVEPVDARQEVVIAQHQKSIAMLTVPTHHVVGRGVAVAVERVSMGVALVPVHGDRSLCGCRGLTGLQSPCGAAERQKKSKSGGTVHGPRFYRDPSTTEGTRASIQDWRARLSESARGASRNASTESTSARVPASASSQLAWASAA